MSNALICYPNRADECTLSGGSWTVGLPLSNLQTRDIKRYSRSTNTSAESTKFTAAFSAARSIRLVSLVNTNLSRDATYRIRWAADAGFTSVVYDSGYVPVYADGVVPFGSYEWEDEGFWDGRLSAEQIAWYPRDVIHVFPANTWAQYLQVEVVDSGNTDGYVQLGRLFVGKGFEPTYNMAYGRSISHNSATAVTETLGRREIFDGKPLVRSEVFDLNSLSPDEGTTLFDMERQLDVSGEVFYVFDRSDLRNLMRWSFLGRLEKLSPLAYPLFNTHSKQFSIKEIV